MKQIVIAVALSIPLLVSTSSLQASAQEDETCSDASLKGAYGFQIIGTVPGVLAIAGSPE